MENASKALIIAGAILLSILIIAIGMYIYTSAQAQVNNSLTNMNTSEIEGFNSTFSSYDGVQTGSSCKALIGRLISNANTYKEEPAKIPSVSYNTSQTEGAEVGKNSLQSNKYAAVTAENDTADYVTFLNTLNKGFDSKHPYRVVLTMSTEGVIAGVTINYDKDDTRENFTPQVGGDLHGVSSSAEKFEASAGSGSGSGSGTP
jgi:hypothetical protein